MPCTETVRNRRLRYKNGLTVRLQISECRCQIHHYKALRWLLIIAQRAVHSVIADVITHGYNCGSGIERLPVHF